MESRKIVLMNSSAGKERDADVENGLVTQWGEGEGRIIEKVTLTTYTIMCKTDS